MLNGTSAEVIQTRTVGDIEYFRAYIEGKGVKTVCLDDVDMQQRKSPVERLSSQQLDSLYSGHDVVSAQWFDLHTQARQLRLAHGGVELRTPYLSELIHDAVKEARK